MAFILDTDIGSDIDDALTIGLIAGSPDLELVGVTTVYGDTRLRAQLARKYLRLAGIPDKTPVHAGVAEPMSGGDVWWTGHEGSLFSDLELQPVDDRAIGFLCETVASRPGELDVVAIGPLTNIAAALNHDPAFAKNVRNLVVMGGDFRDERIAEHNVRYDIPAAANVFSSDLSIVVGGLNLTKKTMLVKEDREAIRTSGPLGETLAREMEIWWDFIGRENNTPHDPVVAMWLARPDLYDESRASVGVDMDGRTWATVTTEGRVRILDVADGSAMQLELVRRLVAGGAGA